MSKRDKPRKNSAPRPPRVPQPPATLMSASSSPSASGVARAALPTTAAESGPTTTSRLVSFFKTPRGIIAGLAALGILDSLYLSYVKIFEAKPFCAGIGDCETVNSSPYSVFAGVPIAFLGVGMYTVVLLLALLAPRLPRSLAPYVPLATFAIGLGGVLYSAYLTYLELYVIEAICIYCVISAILVTLIFATSLVWLLRGGAIETA